MIEHNRMTSASYDDIRFQRVLLEEMGELLPAKLLSTCDLSRARSVLEIGCGAGAWLRAVARHYPDLHCVGVDQDEHLVQAAGALALREHLPHVVFLAHEINDLSPTLFSSESFDLVHLSLLGRYILAANYPAIAHACATLCRPGGIVCWTEAELPITTSPAFEQVISLFCEALQRAGQTFVPENMWELVETSTSHPGKTVAEHSSYKRRSLGITPLLGGWLRDAGFGARAEMPPHSLWQLDSRAVHETAYAIAISAGRPAHDGFVGLARRFARQVKPLLLRTGVINELEHSTLCDQLEEQLTSREFFGLSFLLRAWAPHP